MVLINTTSFSLYSRRIHVVDATEMEEIVTERKVGLIIQGLTVDEAKELMQLVRTIEQRHPDETIFCVIKGLEDEELKEAMKVFRKIFTASQQPMKGVI